MDIAISEQAKDYLKAAVDKGLFPSTGEAAARIFELGVQSLYEQQRQEQIARGIDKGLEDVKAGRVRPFDHSYVEDLKARIRVRMA